MSVIDKNQGAVKQSELAADQALEILNTAINEDGMTILNQIHSVMGDAHRKTVQLILSTQKCRWVPGALVSDPCTLFFNDGINYANVIVKTFQTEPSAVSRTVDLQMTGAAANAATTFNNVELSNGEILYIIVDRSAFLASAGTVIVENNVSSVSAAATRLEKTTFASMPALLSNQSGTSQTFYIPIACRIDYTVGSSTLRGLWWIKNGIRWPEGTVALIGEVGQSNQESSNGDDLNTLKFKASFRDGFQELPDVNGSVDISAGKTNPNAYSAVNKYYRLSYDAQKTVTGTGTGPYLFNSAPTYISGTLSIGDLLVIGNEARRITAVNSPTSVNIEASFSVNPSVTPCLVCQAFYSKDLNAYAGDGLAPMSVFGTTISSMLLTYDDTSADGDIILDTGAPASIAYSASSDDIAYSFVGVRSNNIDAFNNIIPLPSSGTKMLLRFFPNKAPGSGAGQVNLLRYKVFFHAESGMDSGLFFDQAFCMTDGTGTEINCSAPTVVSGKTRIQLGFNYTPGLNNFPTLTANGHLEVFINGQKIPRYVSGSTPLADAWYVEINANTIELDSDYSGFNFSVEVLKRVAIIDTNNQNAANIAANAPPGEIRMYVPFVYAAPAGFLFCDGASYLRTDYPALFNILGGTSSPWGLPSPTTFNVPDFRGRTPIGAGVGPANYLGSGNPVLTNRLFAGPIGAETHTLITAELPVHSHAGTTNSDGNHDHTAGTRINTNIAGVGGPIGHDVLMKAGSSGINGSGQVQNTGNSNHTHSFVTNNTGSGNAHNNMQPSLAVQFIIKT